MGETFLSPLSEPAVAFKAVRLQFTEDGASDGQTNMARDRALLEAAEQGRFGARVYSWDGPWVSLGRFQSPERDLVDPQRTNWVIRPTGGKAVLHGHDVTVAIGAPLALLGVESRRLKLVYRAIVQPLVEAMRACGVPAVPAESRGRLIDRPSTADCFAAASPNDIVDETTGHKVCGCALRLTETAVLVQASLPNGPPLVDPATMIRNAAALTFREWDSAPFAESLRGALARFATESQPVLG